MKTLVIGSGGREHALAWHLSRSDKVKIVYVAPGNGGTEALASAHRPQIVNIPLSQTHELVEFAKNNHIDLTVVGPEAPLAAGIVDEFRKHQLLIFGPTQAAAMLESSKDFAKNFMVKHNIPTAQFKTFTDAKLAHEYIDQQGAPIVIKADGLAAGKGVVVAMNTDEAHAAVDNMLTQNSLGSAGCKVVIEEFLTGEEASFIVITDGKHIIPLATSQDHKRLLDGDLGPNTGGMGAYSPAPVVTPDIYGKIIRQIIRPTIEGMASDGVIYTGFLYAGVMISPNGDVRTLEFNCRMGDPETQPILARLKSDLFDCLKKVAEQKLTDDSELEWDRRTAMGVVLAAENYPQSPTLGDEIHLPNDHDPEALIFHAGTRKDEDGKLYTSGGRVLCCVALGDSPKIAHKSVYQLVEKVKFRGMQYRQDIGVRAFRN